MSASISSALAETLSQEGEDVEVLCPQPTRPQNFRYEENEIIETGYMITRVNSFTYPASGFIGRMRESYSFGKYCAAHIAVNHTKIKGVYANTWPLLEGRMGKPYTTEFQMTLELTGGTLSYNFV